MNVSTMNGYCRDNGNHPYVRMKPKDILRRIMTLLFEYSVMNIMDENICLAAFIYSLRCCGN